MALYAAIVGTIAGTASLYAYLWPKETAEALAPQLDSVAPPQVDLTASLLVRTRSNLNKIVEEVERKNRVEHKHLKSQLNEEILAGWE